MSTKSSESCRLAGAATTPRGMPSASTTVERLIPCFARSTGFLPAFSVVVALMLFARCKIFETYSGLQCYWTILVADAYPSPKTPPAQTLVCPGRHGSAALQTAVRR